MFIDFNVTLHVESYIADPYLEEQSTLVDIQKKSGMNRARSEDSRQKSLMLYLEKHGMTMEYYQGLEKTAREQWFRGPDGLIVIPRHHLSGCLVQACYAPPPAGARLPAENLRSMVQISDFATGRTQADGVFSRFVLPKDGKGSPLSNQRALRKNENIKDFKATGMISVNTEDARYETVKALLTFAGKHVGTGASRKMGYGRFTVVSMDQAA